MHLTNEAWSIFPSFPESSLSYRGEACIIILQDVGMKFREKKIFFYPQKHQKTKQNQKTQKKQNNKNTQLVLREC